LRVIVACEFSGVVRDAFRRRGHDAISCDILPTEAEGPHIQGDIREVDLSVYDLMIAHPPCTHIAVSGAWCFKNKQAEQAAALEFVRFLLDAPVAKIALENPVSIISSRIRKPDQIIQPYQFGEDASKKTCLWLKNLPKLTSTLYVEPRIIEGRKIWGNPTPTGQNKLGPSPNRAKERGRTYRGIAEALADQWGRLDVN